MIGCEYPSSFVYYKYEYLNWALQTGGVFLIYDITSNIYGETKVRIFSSLNSCLQGVVELIPSMYVCMHVCILHTK